MNMSSRFIFANAFITLYIICSLIVISCSNVHSANDIKFNLGKEASNKIISNLDISINIKGSNLPIGLGTALNGEKIFNTKCISCHHDKDIGRQEQMFILYNSENSSIPISSDWSFSFTLFDMIYNFSNGVAPKLLIIIAILSLAVNLESSIIFL